MRNPPWSHIVTLAREVNGSIYVKKSDIDIDKLKLGVQMEKRNSNGYLLNGHEKMICSQGLECVENDWK